MNIIKYLIFIFINLVVTNFRSCWQENYIPSRTELSKIYQKDYESLHPALKQAFSSGIKNVNDFANLYSRSQKNLLDSEIHQYYEKTHISMSLITYYSNMIGKKKSVMEVTRIIGIKNGIGTTIGISPYLREMAIWNDSLVNQTLFSQTRTKQLIDNVFIPSFKRGDYFNGTKSGVTSIIKMIEYKYLTKKESK
ncbi:MAG: TPM domain-containing protein [Bacteroidota bacterium]|nr:TPM domain-containing protein [Bacteroidota bacterium]